MKEKIFAKLKPMISLALFIGLGIYLSKQVDTIRLLKSIDPFWLSLLLIAHFINYILLGQSQAQALKTLNVHLNVKEWFGLSVIAELFNYILPAKGGTSVRYYYLKSKFDVSFVDFMVMTTTYIFVGLSSLGIIGLILVQFFFRTHDKFTTVLNIADAILAISAPVFIIGFIPISKWFKLKANHGPQFYTSQKAILIKCFSLYMGLFLLYPFKIAFSFYALGLNPSPLDLMEISLILLVISLFPVLPGNVGIKELATAYLGQKFGLSFEASLMVSMVDRAVLSLFIIPSGLIFYVDLFLQSNWRELKRPLVSPVKTGLQNSSEN